MTSAERDDAFRSCLPAAWRDEYCRARRNEFRLQRDLAPVGCFEPVERALELGCGVGYKAMLWSDFAGHVDGVDLPEPYHPLDAVRPSVEIGREALAAAGVDGVTLHAADLIEFMAARPASYDVVYSDYVLEHVPDLEPLLGATFDVLRPGGWAVHQIPTSVNASFILLQGNLRRGPRPLLSAIRATVRARLRGERRHPRLTSRGWLVPMTHSEFIDSYADQFDLYRLERTIEPLLEVGFRVRAVTPAFEGSVSVFVERPAEVSPA